MSYEVFQTKVMALAKRAGGKMKVWFAHDDTGRHLAYFSDGTVISGNETTMKVFVRWNGFNHTSIVELA